MEKQSDKEYMSRLKADNEKFERDSSDLKVLNE